MHNEKRIQSRSDVIKDDAGAFRQTLQLAYRGWFQYVKESEENQADQKTLPGERHTDQRDELACRFVDDNPLRIFFPASARHCSSCGDPDSDDDQTQENRDGRSE